MIIAFCWVCPDWLAEAQGGGGRALPFNIGREACPMFLVC